jgi:chemotaxis protein methyltransferase CheR
MGIMTGNISKRDFQQLSSFIYSNLGIKMPESKTTMLTGRLSKRLRELSISSFADYCDFLFSPEGQESELVHLINVITTNKTDFFREPSHFSYLTDKVLPTLQSTQKFNGRNSLKLWSAGCSTGEEPYTLAMVLAEVQTVQKDFRYDILATDISTQVLKVAQRAVYPMRLIDPVSPQFRKKYLLKGKDKKNLQVRIVPELRQRVRFGRLNFMDNDFGLPEMVDIIFCRNVIIYFDKETQERLMLKFCRYLKKGGYLFLGHSESLHGYKTPLVQVAPTIYRYL